MPPTFGGLVRYTGAMNESFLAFHPPDPTLKIRPVRLTDVGTLHAQCFPDRPDITVHQLVIRARQIARQGRGMGIVVASDEINLLKGYGQLTMWPKCAEISDLMVPERFRGQGIGTAMIQYLVRVAREMHAPYIEIGAALSNVGAVSLYRRLGFTDNHTTTLDLGDGIEPVLFLHLPLENAR